MHLSHFAFHPLAYKQMAWSTGCGIYLGGLPRRERKVKPIKMLILVVLTLAVMVFASTSPATAESTSLCSTDENSCAESNQITHVHETSVSKAKIKSEGLPTVECNVLFLGDSVSWFLIVGEKITFGANGLSSGSLLVIGKFTYSSCNNFCSVTEENWPAEIKVFKSGSELASVTGESLVKVACPFINCSYNGVGLEGHGLGALLAGGNGSILINEQEVNKETGGEICPAEAFLTIATTPLTATYISS